MPIDFERLADSLVYKRWSFTECDKNDDVSMEGKQLVLLVDIAKSLRAIAAIVQCNNARKAAIAVQRIEKMLADERKPKPRKTKKTTAKAVKIKKLAPGGGAS